MKGHYKSMKNCKSHDEFESYGLFFGLGRFFLLVEFYWERSCSKRDIMSSLQSAQEQSGKKTNIF